MLRRRAWCPGSSPNADAVPPPPRVSRSCLAKMFAWPGMSACDGGRSCTHPRRWHTLRDVRRTKTENGAAVTTGLAHRMPSCRVRAMCRRFRPDCRYEPLSIARTVDRDCAARMEAMFDKPVDDDPPGTRPPPLPEEKPERYPEGLWQRVGEYWWLGLDAGKPGITAYWTGNARRERGNVFPGQQGRLLSRGRRRSCPTSFAPRARVAGFPYIRPRIPTTSTPARRRKMRGETHAWVVTAERPEALRAATGRPDLRGARQVEARTDASTICPTGHPSPAIATSSSRPRRWLPTLGDRRQRGRHGHREACPHHAGGAAGGSGDGGRGGYAVSLVRGAAGELRRVVA